jgi:ketosteroid isomerase-like protein
MNGDPEREIAEAEVARRTAMVAGDIATLARLLDPAGWYCHGTGERQANLHWLDLLSNGTYRFSSVEEQDQEILVHNDIAVVLGTVSFQVTVAGSSVSTRRQATKVWTRGADGWRLFMYSGVMIEHGTPRELATEIAAAARALPAES